MMNNIGFKEMHQLIDDGCYAYNYIWEHYDELNRRPAAFFLYGPPSDHIGVLSAGKITPSKDRKLSTKTKRKRYSMYELNHDFQVIRVRHMVNYGEIHCTYQLTEINGVTYACPFFKDEKTFYKRETVAVKLSQKGPEYCAITSRNYLYVNFYEYPRPDFVCSTCYLYYPKCTYTSAGLPASWDAPLGAQNSPVTLDYCEEPYHHFDFSKLLT